MTDRQFVISSHWGAGIASVRDGKLTGVAPHPRDPDPSPISENWADSLHGSARVLRPAVRRSYLERGPGNGDGSRGEEAFVEVTWEKALTLIADELKRVYTAHGSNAIYAGSYGWASAGRLHHAQSQLKRFLGCAGGFVRSEGNYSYHAALVLMPHIVGNFREHVKLATRWETVARHGELAVLFGGLPLRNTQVSGGGVGRHTLKNTLAACRASGVRFVNISPLRTDVNDELDAEWLPPRPGSDTAIMMGLAHTLYTEGLHDQAFLERYTVGFEQVVRYLMGHGDDGVEKNAAWAEAQSGIDSERIRALAREMASRRTLIGTAVSLQRADFGEQPLWMTVTLAAMLGQIGLPGGGFGIGYGADAAIGTLNRPFAWPSFPQGSNPETAYIPVAMVADMLLNPGGEYDFDGERRTFPDIRLVWWAGGNPFHHHQDLNRLRAAFHAPETIIVNEINWTATARHADIVLPVASTMERDDFGGGTQDRAIIPMPKVVATSAEMREEFDIYTDLEAALHLGHAFSNGKTSREWLEDMWRTLRQRAAERNVTLPELDDFLAGDVIEFDDPRADGVYLDTFREDPAAHPLITPSGKIELYSERIASFGYADCPGQATWLPPREWLGADLARRYPLHLISGQPQSRLHSQLDNGAYSQRLKVKGREPVLLNPTDASARGIRDGDVVRLKNDRGQCLAGAKLTDDVRPGVVFLWTGAWFDPDLGDPEQCERHGNPNVLTHDHRTSRLSQGPAAQSALVEVEKFIGEVPDVRAFTPPISD
ncbi:MAG: molybdopterin-dependent oxidoreductase [Pseudomonadota bacterium]